MGSRSRRTFNVERFLHSSGLTLRAVEYPAGSIIYAQGTPCDSVLFIQNGSVKVSVLSSRGREAVVGVLGRGDFLGEGALAGQPVRFATASALVDSRVLPVPKKRMVRLLHQQPKLADRFLSYMLARNLRLEEDLIDQLFNASEKRLARTLLLLARYGKAKGPQRELPRLSQEVLAEMIGSTRSRVNFFMNKFRRLGFIDYNRTITVHDSLLSVVLYDAPDHLS